MMPLWLPGKLRELIETTQMLDVALESNQQSMGQLAKRLERTARWILRQRKEMLAIKTRAARNHAEVLALMRDAQYLLDLHDQQDKARLH